MLKNAEGIYLYFGTFGSFCRYLIYTIIIKNVDWPHKYHHSLLALVRLMAGLKSKNQQSQKGKQLVVIILIWGGHSPQKKKTNQTPQKPTNQPWGKLSQCFMLLSTDLPPANIMLQIFSYIVHLDNLQTLNTFLCL